MTERKTRYRFPRAARIVRSDDFGSVIRSTSISRLALGRGLVSVGVKLCPSETKVRFGFTVGKHNVPRSVDRVLAKRIMRDVARKALPHFRAVSKERSVGMDVVLRIRVSLGSVGTDVSVREIKDKIRQSTQDCVRAIEKKIVLTQAEKS